MKQQTFFALLSAVAFIGCSSGVSDSASDATGRPTSKEVSSGKLSLEPLPPIQVPALPPLDESEIDVEECNLWSSGYDTDPQLGLAAAIENKSAECALRSLRAGARINDPLPRIPSMSRLGNRASPADAVALDLVLPTDLELPQNSRLLRVLVANGADLFRTDREGQSPLQRALPRKSDASLTALRMMVRWGNLELNKGAAGTKVLVEMIRSCHLQATALLLDAKAPVNGLSSDGFSPLLYSSSCSNENLGSEPTLFHLLLSRGAVPSNHKFGPMDGQDLLTYHLRKGNKAAVSVLLEAGARPGGRDLMYALDTDDLELLQRLLDRGANPNATLSEQLVGTAPILSFSQSVEAFNLLVSRGADPTQTRGLTLSVLSQLILRDSMAYSVAPDRPDPAKFRAILDRAFELKGSFKGEFESGNALHVAVGLLKHLRSHVWNLELEEYVVKRLIKAGANVNERESRVGSGGFTPLHLAISPSPTRLLLAAGADPTVKSAYQNETPLEKSIKQAREFESYVDTPGDPEENERRRRWAKDANEKVEILRALQKTTPPCTKNCEAENVPSKPKHKERRKQR